MRGDIPRCDACRALSVDAHLLKAEGGPTTDPRSCRRQNQTRRIVVVPGRISPLLSKLGAIARSSKRCARDGWPTQTADERRRHIRS